MILWVLLSVAGAADPELVQAASEVTSSYASCQAAERGPASVAYPVCEGALETAMFFSGLLDAHPEWPEVVDLRPKADMYVEILKRAQRHLLVRLERELALERRRESEREYAAAFAAAAARAGVPITNEGAGVLARIELSKEEIRILERVFFDSSSAEVDPRWLPLLDEVALVILDNPGAIGRVEVAGHSDSTGDPQANLELSQARAEAVAAVLVAEGVSPLDLVVKGYGGTMPVATNGTPEGRERNRRVEFHILEAAELLPPPPPLDDYRTAP